MKKNVFKTEIAALLLLLFSLGVMAQNGNKNVISQTRDIATFNGIKVSGVFKVIFTQGEPQSVKIETDENLMNKISTEVTGGILELVGTKGSVNNPSKMIVYITARQLKSLDMSGASKFTTTNKIIAQELKLELSGISAATLTADVVNVKCEISGVSKLDLQGSGYQLTADISGTAKLLASKFEVKEVVINTSGVGSAIVNAIKSVSLEASGASKIKYIAHDNLVIESKYASGASQIDSIGGNASEQTNLDVNKDLNINTDISTEISTNGDSTKVKVGKLNIEVIDGPQTEVRLGRNKLVVDENGKVQFSKTKRNNSFNSHWGGCYLGLNGYLTPSGKTDPDVHDNFMTLDFIKSTNIQFNIFEKNLKISDHMGFVTGLGIDWRNYRFKNKNVVLQSTGNYFDGNLMSDANYKKSKLLVTYITVPLLFEIQKSRSTTSFHIAGGISSGLRVGSHSKVKFEKPNGGSEKNKNRDDFNLNPFKLDATMLIGWGGNNFYGTYGLINMFKVDKGPELRTFSFGVRLVMD